MRLVKKTTLFMLLLYFLIYIFIIVFSAYDCEQSLYNRLSNRLYSENSVVFVDSQDADWINEQYNGKYRLYVEINYSCRALIQNKSPWIPPLTSGYFPSDNETEFKAVVGKNIHDNSTIERNGKRWIKYLDQEFEVVGIAGTDYITSCDDVVILFGIDFEPESLRGMNIVLDADDSRSATNITNKILNDNPSVASQNGTLKGTARLTKNSYFYKLIIVESILLVIFSLLSFWRYWYEKNKTIRYVYMFHGISPFKLIIHEIAEIIIVNTISLSIAVLISCLPNLSLLNQPWHILFIGAFLTLFSCALVIFFFSVSGMNNILKKRKSTKKVSK